MPGGAEMEEKLDKISDGDSSSLDILSKFYNEFMDQFSKVSKVMYVDDPIPTGEKCPVCGAPILSHYEANKPVADFFCDECKSDFELKSKESKTAVIGHKIADGAYGTMIERITSLRNPHLFVMTYANWTVNNLLIIPKRGHTLNFINFKN